MCTLTAARTRRAPSHELSGAVQALVVLARSDRPTHSKVRHSPAISSSQLARPPSLQVLALSDCLPRGGSGCSASHGLLHLANISLQGLEVPHTLAEPRRVMPARAPSLTLRPRGGALAPSPRSLRMLCRHLSLCHLIVPSSRAIAVAIRARSVRALAHTPIHARRLARRDRFPGRGQGTPHNRLCTDVKRDCGPWNRQPSFAPNKYPNLRSSSK